MFVPNCLCNRARLFIWKYRKLEDFQNASSQETNSLGFNAITIIIANESWEATFVQNKVHIKFSHNFYIFHYFLVSVRNIEYLSSSSWKIHRIQ